LEKATRRLHRSAKHALGVLGLLFVAAGCTSPAHVLTVEPQELVATPGGTLAQDTEAAIEIGWDEILRMSQYSQPHITWYLPCAAPRTADGSTIITYAATCSSSGVRPDGTVWLRWAGSIASSDFAWALVGLKGYDLPPHTGYYSGDRADEERIQEALVTAGL
jgi:hypothetical protein